MNNNGQEAYDKLCEFRDEGTLYDKVKCVITDIEMPQMDGHRLTKLIKDDKDMKDLPVIIFSSLVNDEMRRKGESLGANAQLSKPEIGNHFRPTAKIRMSSAPSQKLGMDVSISVKLTEKRS